MDWKKPLVAVALALAAAPAAAEEAGTVAKPAEVKAKKRDWSAAVVYSHAFTTMSLDKTAEPTWNPMYMHVMMLQPTYNLGESFFVAGQLGFEQELTDGWTTSYKHQVIWYDATLQGGWKGWTEESSKIHVAGTVGVALPLSMMSQAQTQYLSVTPALSLSRNFDVLKGLTLALSGSMTKHFNEYTTSEIPSGIEGVPSNSGDLNASTDLVGGVAVSLVPVEKLTLGASVGLVDSILYDAATNNAPTASLADASDDRFAQSFALTANYAFMPELNLGTSVSTGSGQLRPDGQRRSLLFNRFTMVSVDLGISLDAIADDL